MQILPQQVEDKFILDVFGELLHQQEVIGEVVQSTLQEALIQEKLRPAGWPKIEPQNAEPGQAFEYNATFEVYPEIELNPLDKITIERPVVEITDEDIDKLVDKLRLQQVTWSPLEREAKEEDQLIISFKGMVDGEAFQGGVCGGMDIEYPMGSPAAHGNGPTAIDGQFRADV